jgi:hypothetical protein
VAGQKQVIFEAGGYYKGLNLYVDDGNLYAGAWWNDDFSTFLSTDAISADTWHHVALVLDAEDSNNVQPDVLSAYLDGVQFGMGEARRLGQHSRDIGIGAVVQNTRFHSGNVVGSGEHTLAGSVGDLQIYNRALDASEVASLASVLNGSDTTVPTAVVDALNLATAGETAYTFTVTYSDDVGIDITTLDNNDIRVTGPGNFEQIATLIDVTGTTATYQITAPNSEWGNNDNGIYNITLESDQVSDTSGNFAAAGTLGSFNIDIPQPNNGLLQVTAETPDGDVTGGYALDIYDPSQDNGVTVTLEDNGDTLKLEGNGWRKVALPYTITADTVLEFDFKSTEEGEIHAIGFDVDDVVSYQHFFELYGTQDWGIEAFQTYGDGTPGEWQHYRIEVGQFFTGQMDYLTFGQDQDSANGPQHSNSFFSNIRIYEASPPAVVPPPVTGDVSTTALVTHFTFDQPAGSIAVDNAPFTSQGQEDPGRLQNGAAFVDTGTTLQGAVQLDGVDDYVTVQDSTDINHGTFSKRTVSAWFKVDDTAVAGQKQVIFEAGGNDKGLNIYLDDGHLYAGAWWNSDFSTFLSTDAISADTWHHVALVLDADNSNDVQTDVLSAYLDGVQFGVGDAKRLRNHVRDIGIGAISDQTRFHNGGGVTSSGSHTLAGSIADLQIYKRALDTSEVASLAGVLSDSTSLNLTAGLSNDTGTSNTDGLTTDAAITGTLNTSNGPIALQARLGDSGAYVDISEALEPDGSFAVSAVDLETLLGVAADGIYNLNLLATNALGVSESTVVAFTLDRTGPELSLISPIVDGNHSPVVHLVGDANEAGQLAVSLNGATPISLAVAEGEIDQVLQALPLTTGAHQVAFTFTDAAGNITQNTIDFSVVDSGFQIGGSGTQGWVARSNETIVLGESDSYVVEATHLIDLGQTEGNRILRFAVDTAFDNSDATTHSQDQLAVYLVDPNDTSQTLLDGGQLGTPVFILNGETADYIPGQVSYDGQFVEIDLSSLADQGQGLLVFQLLNQDGDEGGRITIGDITNQINPEGTPKLVFVDTPTVATAGGALNLNDLSLSSEVEVQFSDVRFDATAGQYTATLRLHNTSDSDLGRNVAVLFGNLPSGISLTNASGADANGDSYINFRNAIQAGGLTAGSFSDGIEISFSNPNQLRLALQPQVYVGGPNQAPVLDPLGPLSVMPGHSLEIPLAATDPDGDTVTYSIRSDGDLPLSRLQGNKLVFEPSPDQVGSYAFTLVASDGALETTQAVTLDVVADPDTTTRISGRVLDTEGNPLANLPIELGRLQTVTDAQGYFSLTIADTSFPSEELDIAIPLGDPAFDPFSMGDQVIDLRRTTADNTTGTDASNPLRHPNLVSAFMDGSMIYGNSTAIATALRTNDGTGQLQVSANGLLPLNNSSFFPDGPLPNVNRSQTDPATLFATGDVRANENIGLTALHTVFVKEHNRLAAEIASDDPSLSGEAIYQRARKQVTAQLQHITYSEYLPLLLGEGTIASYQGYDPTVDSSISHLFAAAAFRLGHTQGFDEFLLVEGGNTTALSLGESTFAPDVLQQHGIDPILRGLYAQSAQEIDLQVIDELRNTLFGPPGAGGIDLAAVDIERGRDLGLPDYNQARIDFGLAPVTSFADITSDTALQAALEQLYGSVDNIDVIVGGLAEDKAPGAMVGSLFQRVLADQFARLRDGDRLWYENGQFTATELNEIRTTTLSGLITRNTSISDLPGYLFSKDSDIPNAPAAAGTVAAAPVTDYASIDGSGHNLDQPDLGQAGSVMRVDYTQEYGDGISTPGGGDRPNSREISNTIFDQDTSIPDPSGATGFMVAWSQFMGHDLSFTPAGAADTLKFYGTEYQSPTGEDFPFVAEKLELVLGHGVYRGVDNVIERPIYLPALDPVSAHQYITDTQGTTTVTNDALGASVEVAADSLIDQAGQPFAGQLTISEVLPEVTPAALPDGLSPDLVVTIQPGEMAFTQPARLSLPNEAGWASGMEMELWSINPTTGEFEIVGTGQVSDDGTTINTMEGGIRNSSWHFFATPPGDFEINQSNNRGNTCSPTGHGVNGAAGALGGAANAATNAAAEALENFSGAAANFSSQVDLQTGAVIETHNLVSYQSQGQQRGIQLVYDSLRADARPIVQANFGNVDANALAPGFTDRLRLIAEMTIDINGLDYTVPGYGGGLGLDGGEHFWRISDQAGPASGSLQADLRDVESGVYNFDLSAGIYINSQNQRFVGSSATQQGQLVHVNTVDSAFGSGWGIAGTPAHC